MKLKKYKFSISNGKFTFYTTIEGSGRFDVEERMKMMYKDCKSIVFMGEVLQNLFPQNSLINVTNY